MEIANYDSTKKKNKISTGQSFIKYLGVVITSTDRKEIKKNRRKSVQQPIKYFNALARYDTHQNYVRKRNIIYLRFFFSYNFHRADQLTVKCDQRFLRLFIKRRRETTHEKKKIKLNLMNPLNTCEWPITAVHIEIHGATDTITCFKKKIKKFDDYTYSPWSWHEFVAATILFCLFYFIFCAL